MGNAHHAKTALNEVRQNQSEVCALLYFEILRMLCAIHFLFAVI